MEYFTAHYIADNIMSGSVTGLVESHFRDLRWLEVFLLTAGKLGHQADELLIRMQMKNREIIGNVPELKLLLQTVKYSLLPNESRYSKGAREAGAAFFILLFVRDHAYYHAMVPVWARWKALDPTLKLDPELTNYTPIYPARALSHTLDLAQALAGTLGLDVHRSNGLVLGLTPKSLEVYGKKAKKIDLPTVEKISNYFVGNVWIVRCLNSGATISTKVREHILDGLFKPEGD